MASYVIKTLIGNKVDKVFKEFGGDDKNKDSGISEEELADEQRQAANEKERQARRADIEKERAEARQKIRDKYSIKKKGDPPTTTKNQQQGKTSDQITRTDTANVKLEKTNGPEPQGFQPMKTMSDAFSGLKRKFGRQ